MGVHGLLSYALGRVEEQGRGSWRSLRGACLIADGHSVAHWIAEEALEEDYVAWAGGFERWLHVRGRVRCGCSGPRMNSDDGGWPPGSLSCMKRP
jgi:hypothetical protein